MGESIKYSEEEELLAKYFAKEYFFNHKEGLWKEILVGDEAMIKKIVWKVVNDYSTDLSNKKDVYTKIVDKLLFLKKRGKQIIDID
jgi:hypothetical protein